MPDGGAEGPGLAVVVLSLANQPGVVDAVRSLVAQSERAEIVVVNSGGGDPAPGLTAAGLGVAVVNRTERLLPGAARNAGVDATGAPFVAFLAADCRAEPGWVSGRLRAHRAGAAAVASAMSVETGAHAEALASHVLLYATRMPSAPAGDRALYGISYARELLERLGRFREDLRQGEDTELNARLTREVSIHWAPEVKITHASPRGVADLLADEWARGRRSSLYRHLGLGPTLRAAAVRRSRRALRALRRLGPHHGRLRPLGAALLLPPACAVYAVGILTTRLKRAPRRG